MSEHFDRKQDVERLDYCPCCEGNFLNFQPEKPIQHYDGEWLLALACNACGFEENIPASDEGLQTFNAQIAETSLSVFTEAEKISNMTVGTFMTELEKAGLAPPIGPSA